MAASFSLSLHETFRWRWKTILACNVEIVLSADEAVRIQMKFWNDNHILMYFNMVVKNYHLFSVIRVSFIDVINYSTVRVRPTLSDITAIRSPVLAIFLANRHDNTKQMENEKHWRLQETVNLPPYGIWGSNP